MIFLALALSSAAVDCKGVVDKTRDCPALADEAAPVAVDARTVPAPPPGIDADKLPGELAFAGIGIALGGGAALALSYANNPRTDDERLAQSIERWTAGGLFAWSALVGGSALALWVFDPAKGDIRLKLFEGSD